MTEPFSLTEDERDLLERGKAYKDLAAMHGWPMLLEFLQRWEDSALQDLGSCQSSDERVLKGLWLRWKSRAELVQDLQSEVQGTIDQRRQWLLDMAESRRYTQEVQEVLAREEIRS